MFFRDTTTRYNISRWQNKLKGHTVFILGNGPSILDEDNKLNLLNNYFTIGVNRIFKLYEPVILFWQDIELIRDFNNEVRDCCSIKVCRDIADPQKRYSHFTVGLDPYRFGENPADLHGRGCSGMIAAQMSILMGCSNIVLLGVDCKYDGRRTDFYGRNRFHKRYTLINFVKACKWLQESSPVPVYNCGEVPFWPRESLKSVIKKINPPRATKLEYMSLLKR